MKLLKPTLTMSIVLVSVMTCGCYLLDFNNTFRNMDELFPSSRVERPDQEFTFERELHDLDVTYQYKGRDYSLDQLFKRTDTTGFIVVKNDKIVYERYFKGADEDSLFTSWSMAKSFLSALIGIAIDEGHIESVDDPVSKYAPELEGSGYEGVPIKHVLQMSSGIDFNEEYYNLTSDIYVMLEKVFFFNQPIEETIVRLDSERPSGERFHYISVDSQVLGMVLESATGRPAAELLEEKIWTPLGMESDAAWNTDGAGVALSFCCLNATLRDYARFGRLYLRKGNWEGRQIVPERWVMESVTPDSPHLMPGETMDGWGYQYQWWVPPDPDGEFMAIGVFGQYIYVNQKEDLVIVKTSADVKMADVESLAAFRAIADYLSSGGAGIEPEGE